ncbi:hypothetical protein ACS5PK_08590 [Roseateles sp. DB2]|uniref:hypothetical protein n=1 Tax=Roseateles sp. DB2 TaxID=3453717 RepID=UPI003EF05CFA
MDDGQALQRRLLHDMERQWLSTWAQADQQHDKSKQAASSTTGGSTQASEQAQDPLDAPDDVQGHSACPTSAPLQPSMPPAVDSQTEDSTEQAFNWRPRPDGETPACGAAKAASARLDGPQRLQGLDPSSQAGSSATWLLPATAAEARPASSGDVHSLDSQAQPKPLSRAAPASHSSFQDAAAYGSPPPIAGAAHSIDLVLPQAVHAQTAMRPSGDEASSEATAPAVPSAKPDTANGEELTHDRQRLTLREIDAGTVQALLRDAQLDAQASGLAARSLHHALMEAGYARVKVVVNGQTARTDTAQDAPADRDDSQRSPQAAIGASRRTSTPLSQENTYGYQP